VKALNPSHPKNRVTVQLEVSRGALALTAVIKKLHEVFRYSGRWPISSGLLWMRSSKKRLALSLQQLTDYEQRLHRLPASKKSELKPTLTDLKQRLDALVAKFQAYWDAPLKKSAGVLEELKPA
jgi:hypothetical protein